MANLSSSCRTEAGGLSCGVGVCHRPERQSSPPLDFGPFEFPLPHERVKLRIVEGLLPHGVLFVSLYLITGEDFNGANRAILNATGERIRALGIPFVVGGGFQNEPELLRATGWAGALGGIIVSP